MPFGLKKVLKTCINNTVHVSVLLVNIFLFIFIFRQASLVIFFLCSYGRLHPAYWNEIWHWLICLLKSLTNQLGNFFYALRISKFLIPGGGMFIQYGKFSSHLAWWYCMSTQAAYKCNKISYKRNKRFREISVIRGKITLLKRDHMNKLWQFEQALRKENYRKRKIIA